MNARLMMAGSLRTLSRHRLRTFFMGLGVVVGVAALVVTRSLGTGAEEEMLRRMDKLFGAGSIIIVNSGVPMHGGKARPEKLSIADLEAIARDLDEVAAWDPSIFTGGREVRREGVSRKLMIVGHSERADVVWGRGVSRGEFFTAADVASASRVALLGSKTAAALFGGGDPIGGTIRIGNAPFRVKGVLEDHGIDPHGMDRDDEVHVPITTLMRRILDMETIGTAKLLVEETGQVDGAVDRITEILRERHGLGPGQPDDFSIYTPTQAQASVKKANRVVTLYLPATAGIALLVAAIVILNVMLMGVRERIPEIGLRKAMGATPGNISLQFFLEGLLLTAASGLLGVGIASVILEGMALHGLSPGAAMSPGAAALGLAAALLVGALAGLLPARRAARQEPVDALR